MTDLNDEIQHEESLQREKERQSARQAIDEGDPLWQRAQGAQAVVHAVRDLHFPLTRDEIREKAGGRVVETGKGHAFPLGAILNKLKEDAFASPRSFETAVLRHWEGVEAMEVPEEMKPGEGGGFQVQNRDRW